MNTISILAHGIKQQKKINAKIKAILKKHNTVRFTNKITGIIKDVTKWNMNENGDLIASYSSGQSKFVCPYALEYDITEIKNENNKPSNK